MSTIGVVSPGAMGSAVGRGYVEAGHRVLATVSGRSARTAGLAHGLELVDSLEQVVAASDVVLSIVPPGEAAAVARDVADLAAALAVRPLVVDLNAIAPEKVRRIADELGGLDLVDGSISGGPPERAGTRVYLSGARADEVAALGHPRLEIVIVPGPIGTASAVKMCTAGVYKGFSALLTSAVMTASANGVRDLVLADLAREFADTVADLPWQLASAASKSARFVGEMHEIARTQAAAGRPPELFEGIAAVWAQVAESQLGALSPEDAAAVTDLDAVVRALGQS